MSTGPGAQHGGTGAEWEPFARLVAEAAGLQEEQVLRSTRLIEDADLDSLALFEVVVSLLVDYGLEELPAELQQTDWSGVTVGQLYEQIRTYRPPGWQIEWR